MPHWLHSKPSKKGTMWKGTHWLRLSLLEQQRLEQESQRQYHSSDLLGFYGAGPLKKKKKKKVVTTNLIVPCQLCSLREKHEDFSRTTECVVLFPSPSV